VAVLVCIYACAPLTHVAASTDGSVVIRQFQAGGAGSGATTQEYVELYNNSDQDIDVTNWCLHYTGLSSSSFVPVGCLYAPDASTKLLISARQSTLFMSPALEALIKQTNPDFQTDKLFETSTNLAASNGVIKIVNQTGETVDALGWGTVAGEGVSVAGSIPGGKILQRLTLEDGVLKDTNDNSIDFELVDAASSAYASGGLYEQVTEPTTPEPTPESENANCSATGVTITEILANPAGADTSGGEFIELHNSSGEPVSLEHCYLSTDKDDHITLPPTTLQPGEYYAVALADMLLNNGGTVIFVTDTTEEVATYPALSDNEVWGFYENVWQLMLATPGAANILPAAIGNTCSAEGVVITEILANPLGSDSGGGEFVELYNASSQPKSLHGCMLQSDKDDTIELPDAVLEPGQYYAVMLADKLLNGGGSVVLSTKSADEIVAYTELADDESWALIDGVWQITTVPTPGAVNQPSPADVQVSGAATELTPCPSGKFRNPETNRCKNLISAANSLVPCNPGQERNPTTNRCRKTTAASTSLTLCQPGYVRNLSTNRCRKATAPQVAASTSIPPTSGSSPLHPAILLSLSTLLLGYGLYEYRLDLAQYFQKLRSKLFKSTA
jgi:hypothetical protein